MTGPKPLAAHGTYARANGRPSSGIARCTCEPCRKVSAAYNGRRYLLTATGRNLTVDPTRAANHITMLLANGASRETLVGAGCGKRTTHALLNGHYERIYRRTEQRILAIRLADVLSPHRRISPIGTVRRIQALTVVGHQLADIAASSGSSRSHLRNILAGRVADISVAEVSRIAAAYSTLVKHPGTSNRARQRGARAGWAGPMAWGPEIDDPTALPEPEPGDVELSKVDLASDRAAEITHLSSYGVAAHDIAARLGLSLKYVQEQLAGRRRPGWRTAA